jgi:hypothetical protein
VIDSELSDARPQHQFFPSHSLFMAKLALSFVFIADQSPAAVDNLDSTAIF